MASTAYLPIVADRYVACVRHVFVVGIDLRGLDMRAQVRLAGDTPGSPEIDLRTVTNGNAEGLRLVEVTDDDGVPTSHVEIVINETTMEGLPYAGELGDAAQFAWDWQITIAGRKRRFAYGEFEVTGNGVTGADDAPTSRPVGSGRPQQPITSPWNTARLTLGEEQVTVTIDSVDLVAPYAKKATESAAEARTFAAAADQDRIAAQLAAAAALATGRFFTDRAAGEAASTVNQLFATSDGAGSLIYYQRTSGGSAEVARTITPNALQAYVSKAGAETLAAKTFSGATYFHTNNGRISITSKEESLAEIRALLHVESATNDITNGLLVTSAWEGSTEKPYINNDTSLFETYNRTLSNSANYSWSISAPNAYHDIPAGVRDGGIRHGILGWATSVAGKPGYTHRGTLATQIGAWGRGGFQGPNTPNSAKVEYAIGVRGEIVNESVGTTIDYAVAGEFIASAASGITKRSIAVYGFSIGAEANYSFFGGAGRLFNADRVAFGSEYSDGVAALAIRAPGNSVEFGFPDTGYGSNLGSTFASGFPFLALCAEVDPAGNTFRTRGNKSVVVWSDLTGTLIFSRLPTAKATGQAPVEMARFTPEGRFVLANPPVHADNAGAIAAGLITGTVYCTATGEVRIVF